MRKVVVDGMGLGTRGGCLVMSVPVDEEEEEEGWHRQPSLQEGVTCPRDGWQYRLRVSQ